MVNLKKFYKEETILINDEKIAIRAYRPGDGPLVAEMLKLSYESQEFKENFEKRIKDKEEVNPMELADHVAEIRTKVQDIAGVLGFRGFIRSIDKDARRLQAEELDEYIDEFRIEHDFDLDPEEALQIAWTMIGLGFPKAQKVADTKNPKNKGKKGSAAKTSSKT